MPSQNYPSVTEVLRKYQDFSNINPDTLNKATERGTIVHEACARYVKFVCSSSPYSWLVLQRTFSEYKGYVESFIKWFDSIIVKVLHVETRFTDEIYGFTGQPDLIAILKGDDRPTVVDNKTPASYKHIWAGQMAGYLHLARKVAKLNAWRCITLRLKPDGRMPLVDSYQESKRDLQAFLNAVNAHRYFVG